MEGQSFSQKFADDLQKSKINYRTIQQICWYAD